MKATIYSTNGKIIKETDCKRFEPYCGDLHILVFEDEPNAYSYKHFSKYMITNLPVVCKGIDWPGSEPRDDDPEFALRLLNDSGEVVREWLDAKGASHFKDIVTFKSGGEWFSACGNITMSKGICGEHERIFPAAFPRL